MLYTSLIVAAMGSALLVAHTSELPAAPASLKKTHLISRDTIDPDQEEPFTVVENMPSFPGGMGALKRFIKQNIQFPEAAKNAGITGSVYVQFVVNTKGKLSEVKVLLNGLGYGCNEEAQRLISIMPDWIPGSQAGRRVPVRYTLPIQFK